MELQTEKNIGVLKSPKHQDRRVHCESELVSYSDNTTQMLNRRPV